MTPNTENTNAAAAAPEIDRLVWSVNTRTRRDHEAEFGEVAQSIGVDVIFPLDHYAAFLLAGSLTREVAVDRMRYMPKERVLAQIADWIEAGLISEAAGQLTATDAIRPLLDVLRTRRTEVASQLWSAHAAEVEEASRLARVVVDGAPDSLTVAAAHRSLPDPLDPYLLFHQRLVTLRYVRQQAHANAWLERDLDAPRIVAMTQLWHGEASDPDAEVLAGLEQAGYISREPLALTAVGLDVREAIETATDAGTQPAFDALQDADADRFLSLLKSLPGTPV